MSKFPVRINRIMQQFLFTTSVSSFALGLVLPFLAVFAEKEIEGGSIKIAGIAAGISPLMQGGVQFGSGFLLDKLTAKNQRMLFYFFVARHFIDVIYLLSMMLVFLPWHLYLIQGIRGVATGITMPAGGVILVKYIDAGKEGSENGIVNGIVSVFYGLGGILAGIIVASFGFKMLFLAGAIFFAISTIFSFKVLLEYNRAQKVH